MLYDRLDLVLVMIISMSERQCSARREVPRPGSTTLDQTRRLLSILVFFRKRGAKMIVVSP
jgi:hypothetical protein